MPQEPQKPSEQQIESQHPILDAHDFLPAGTTYYFSNEILPGNEFHLVDTKRVPEWR